MHEENFHQNEKNTPVLMSMFYFLSLFIHTQFVGSILVFHEWEKTVTKSYHEIDYHVTINCTVNDNPASVLLHVISKNKMYNTFAFFTVFVKIGQTT